MHNPQSVFSSNVESYKLHVLRLFPTVSHCRVILSTGLAIGREMSSSLVVMFAADISHRSQDGWSSGGVEIHLQQYLCGVCSKESSVHTWTTLQVSSVFDSCSILGCCTNTSCMHILLIRSRWRFPTSSRFCLLRLSLAHGMHFRQACAFSIIYRKAQSIDPA